MQRKLELGTHRFRVEDIISFARRYHPAPEHMDVRFAENAAAGGLRASGWHVAVIAMRLLNEGCLTQLDANNEMLAKVKDFGPMLGFKNLRWLEPVFAEDDITFSAVAVTSEPSVSDPGWSTMIFKIEGFNQRQTKVLAMELSAMVRE